MDLSDAIKMRICYLMEENQLTPSRLSTLAGISRSTLSKFLSGQRKYLRLDILEYICEACHITLADFFQDPIFDDIEVKDE